MWKIFYFIFLCDFPYFSNYADCNIKKNGFLTFNYLGKMNKNINKYNKSVWAPVEIIYFFVILFLLFTFFPTLFVIFLVMKYRNHFSNFKDTVSFFAASFQFSNTFCNGCWLKYENFKVYLDIHNVWQRRV